MYYKEQKIIMGKNFIIDIETGQKFEFRIDRKKMNCFPVAITQEDIQIAEKEGVKIANLFNFSDEQLRERRQRISYYLIKSKIKIKQVIYSGV